MDGVIAIGNVSDEQFSVLRFAMLKNGYRPHVFSLGVDTPPPGKGRGIVIKNEDLDYRAKATPMEIPFSNYTDFQWRDIKAVIWASDVSDTQKARMDWLTRNLPTGFIDYTVCIERYGTCRLKGEAFGTLYMI